MNYDQFQSYLDARDTSKNTALHYACQSGNKEAVVELLKNGANYHARGDYDRTPLQEALKHGKQSCALAIIRYVREETDEFMRQREKRLKKRRERDRERRHKARWNKQSDKKVVNLKGRKT